MKILNLVEEAEAMILLGGDATDVMINLSVEVQTQHEIDLKYAFSRGRISVISSQVSMDADQFYKKFYTDEI